MESTLLRAVQFIIVYALASCFAQPLGQLLAGVFNRAAEALR